MVGLVVKYFECYAKNLDFILGKMEPKELFEQGTGVQETKETKESASWELGATVTRHRELNEG